MSLVIMNSAIMILNGFKKRVSENVFNKIGTHLILPYQMYSEIKFFEESRLKNVKAKAGVKLVPFLVVPAIVIKHRNNGPSAGVLFYGINIDTVGTHVKELSVKTCGSCNNGVIISGILANNLRINCGETLRVTAYYEGPRVRLLPVCGIYSSNIENFDRQFIIIKTDLLYRRFGVDSGLISGVRVFADNRDIEAPVLSLPPDLRLIRISEAYPQIFEWLNTLNMNVIILEVIVGSILIFNMVCAGLIMLIDRIRVIAFLNAMGYSIKSLVGPSGIIPLSIIIMTVFCMIVGGAVSATLGIIQEKFHIIKLDPQVYFIDYVPFSFAKEIIVVWGISLVLMWFSFLLTYFVIKRLPVIRVLRFE